MRINEHAQQLALDVINGKLGENWIKLQAEACEERRKKVERKELDHACPSYVHCLISRDPLIGISGNSFMIIPVCPISIVREISILHRRNETQSMENGSGI